MRNPEHEELARLKAALQWVLERDEPQGEGSVVRRLSSRANGRGHSRFQSKAVREARWAGGVLAMVSGAKHLVGELGSDEALVVHWIRVFSGRERRFDSDNATSALKSERDGFCHIVGLDDSSPRLIFLPTTQLRGAASMVLVRLYVAVIP